MSYDLPPDKILHVLKTPEPPQPWMSPTHDAMILVSWERFPSIARVAEPFLRLAGARVEPRNHSKHDSPGGYGITKCARDFSIVRVADSAETHVALPPGVCASGPDWSADGRRYAFLNTTADSVELWVGESTNATVRRIEGVRLNPMLGSTFQWMPDQKTLLVKLVPDLGPPPAAPTVPDRPSIQETHGEKGESSTYEARDTLKNKHDEDLFDYYAAAQLALVDAASGSVTPLGKVAAYNSLAPAPDGEHILVDTIRKPYSYLTTYSRFPRDFDVWDRTGAVVHKVHSRPLADRVPVQGVPTGPRGFDWRSTEPATLVWAEALDGGDWKVTVPARDKIMIQKAPFTAPPVEIGRTESRFYSFQWGEQPAFALRHEFDENRQWRRTFIVNVDDPKSKPTLLWDMSSREYYKHPGNPVLKTLPNGFGVVEEEGDAIYLAGQGYSPEGARPFLDRLDTRTRKTERLFRSDREAFEYFLAFADQASAKKLLTYHQTPADPPNVWLRTLGTATPGAPTGEAVLASEARPVTHAPDLNPEVRAIKKRLVKYKRKDGVDLSFTLYLPPGYVEGTRVPTILNAYPEDYADPSKAGQVSSSDKLFTDLYHHQLLLLAGYALLDDASFPIVGDPKKAYDTYLEQLVMDAKAAVDEGVRTGVVDPDRIGVTGHSHGALMTANLVAHTDLFRAGVATSGSYNKTLTPFGFQNERRSVWEAQSVYLKVSPFFYADKMKAPLLLIHGDDDANPGTTPLQADKLYEAIRGNGGVARLVMLPHEPHWYSAIESQEQVAYEMVRWFDTYVKEAAPRAGPSHGTPHASDARPGPRPAK